MCRTRRSSNLALTYLRTVKDRFADRVEAPEVVTVRVPVPSLSPRNVQVMLLLPFAGTPGMDCVALESRNRATSPGLQLRVADKGPAAPPELLIVAVTVNSSPRETDAGAVSESVSTGSGEAGAVTVSTAVSLVIPS